MNKEITFLSQNIVTCKLKPNNIDLSELSDFLALFLPLKTISILVVKISVNPLRPDIKMHILFTVLHTLLMEVVQRICLNIKTSHP